VSIAVLTGARCPRDSSRATD